jgi:hypothetical protein
VELIDLKTGQKLDSQGNVVFDEAGEATLEEVYSVATGTVLTINTKTKKLFNGEKELIDISASLTLKSGVYKSWWIVCYCIWKSYRHLLLQL